MNKETLQDIFYFPLYLYFKIHAMLPLPVLYILADILYLPLFYIVRYRRKLVFQNMKNSFPEKNTNELRKMEKAFYRHFCNYIVETIKLMHISDKEMRRRMVFENTEVVEECFRRNQSIIILLGHYGNWEWVPSVTLWTDMGQATFAQIYRPLKNRWFDRFFLKLRSRFGSVSIPKADTLREILKMRNSGKPSITGFMADQTPSPANIHHWVKFLNQETAALTGFEKIARKTGFSVLFFDVEVIKKGYYKTTIRVIESDPKSVPEYTITDRYMNLMEKCILRKPEYWLWTHKRWKYHHQDFPNT